MSETQRSVQSQFGGVAANYASSTVFSAGVDLQLIAAEAARARPRRALDIGTAAGHVAFALAEHAVTVVGLDLTHEMLVTAAARGTPNAGWCQANVERLPFPNGAFDLVTCRLSAHHFPDPEAFAREAFRVGRVVLLADVVAPADPDLDRWINEIETIRDPSHVRDRTVAEWQETLGGAELLLDWRLDLDFDAWVQRIRTPEPAVAELRARFARATPAQRQAFGVTQGSFQLHCAVLRATRPA